MNRIIGSACVLLLSVCRLESTQAQGTNWPVQPTNQDHPLGATLGEFQDVSGAFQHSGIDILVTPCQNPCALADTTCVNPCTQTCSIDPTEDSPEPCVYTTVAGRVKRCNQDSGPNGWTQAQMVTSTGGKVREYIYNHLTYQSFDANFAVACNNPTVVVLSGRPINRVTQWSCDYSHLHYGVWEVVASAAELLNPLGELAAGMNPDPQFPDIFDIHLLEKGPDASEFSPGGACTIVNGEVDIVAHLRDRDDAGSSLQGASNIGVYNLQWRACSSIASECPWNDTHEFKKMLPAWAVPGNSQTSAQFSTALPFQSNFNECPAPNPDGSFPVNETYMFATGAPSASWNTTSVPDGSYVVSVRASDIAGNWTTHTANACIQNGPPCMTDLTVRDNTDDSGAVPYSGGLFYLSPDITVNRGGADENKNVREGLPNTVGVQVWNRGSCVLPASTTYQVCLAWNPPSGSVPFPLPTNQVVDCQTETVPDAWPPGTSRTTTFNWTPAAGTLPAGHACLAAWSTMTADPVQTTPSVILDNNRSQRNLAFITAPKPGGMSFQPFMIYPLEAVSERGLEMSFKSSSSTPYLGNARLHVPAGMTVTQLFDTAIIGGYRGNRPAEVCPHGDETGCVSHCNSWAEAAASGCTLVLGGIGPQSRVRLEGINLSEPTQLLLEVSTNERVPAGEFFEAEIVEYGTIDYARHTAIGGLALRFEGPAR